MNPVRYVLSHLPGWNSLDTVDKLATWTGWFAIIGGLGILMVLEVVAHVYGERKEELITFKYKAEKVPRTISPQARIVLRDTLVKFPGVKIKLTAHNIDSEAVHLCEELGMILRDAKWNVEGPILSMVGTPTPGIFVQTAPRNPSSPHFGPQINKGTISLEEIPSPVKDLLVALIQTGLPNITYYEVANLKPEKIELYIGPKVISN